MVDQIFLKNILFHEKMDVFHMVELLKFSCFFLCLLYFHIIKIDIIEFLRKSSFNVNSLLSK